MSVKLSNCTLPLRHSDEAYFVEDWPAVITRVIAQLDGNAQPNAQPHTNGVVMRERRTQTSVPSITMDELEGTVKDHLLSTLTTHGCPALLATYIANVAYDEVREIDVHNFKLHQNSEFAEIYEDVTLLNSNELLRFATQCVVRRCTALSRLKSEELAELVGLRNDFVRNCVFDTSVYAIKNVRKKMEDRHLIITNIGSLYKNSIPDVAQSLFAVFDGHAGVEAAQYAAAHLPVWLVRGKRFASDLEQAFHDAFVETDAQFCARARRERLKCGSTALCALLRERRLYVSWAGDSQALLLRAGKGIELTEPHKPEREDERRRIEEQNGVVLFLNGWRVNGTLTVSRAIGDVDQKPCVTAEPDVRTVELTDRDDFLILACDGLWDTVTSDLAARTVYDFLSTVSNRFEDLAQKLVTVAQQRGSSDNISCLVVKLRSRADIMADFNRDSSSLAVCDAARSCSASVTHDDDRDASNGAARIKKSLVQRNTPLGTRSSLSLRTGASGSSRQRAVVAQHPRRSQHAQHESDDETITETEAAAARHARDRGGRACSLTLEAAQAIRNLKLDERAPVPSASSKTRRTLPSTASEKEKRKLSFS